MAKKMLLNQRGVRYFSLNASHIQSALKDPAHLNWAQFFQGIKASDVAGSDVQSVAQLFKVLSYSGESHEAAEQTELYSAINEYFRLKFRKLSAKDALQIMLPLGEDTTKKVAMLDDKFWVWETIDEALRPVISDLPEAEVLTLIKAFSANYKGSDDLLDFLFQRVHYFGASPI